MGCTLVYAMPNSVDSSCVLSPRSRAALAVPLSLARALPDQKALWGSHVSCLDLLLQRDSWAEAQLSS